MFSKAYKIASQFTIPIIISSRRLNGEVNSGVASATVLNPDGWALTSYHVFEGQVLVVSHRETVERYHVQVEKIENDDALTVKKRRDRLSKLKSRTDMTQMTNHSLWWGGDRVQPVDIRFWPEADLALVKLEPFPFGDIGFPQLKRPSNLEPGTSLCRLGYPFVNITTAFDAESEVFHIDPSAFPIPRFPIEGMMTRTINQSLNEQKIAFVETSSPGLRGQSGGPIFDSAGVVWGIQSRTISFPLDIAARVGRNGREVNEEQFLNVGWGVHPETILEFLSHHDVEIEVVD